MALESLFGRRARLTIGALVVGGLGLTAPAASEEAPATPETADADVVLARFMARPDEPVTSYRARRRMEVRALGQRAWMTALVELDPERGFRYGVEAEGGSRRLREKSLLRLLEAEAEAHASGLASRSGLTAQNYLIEAAGSDSDGFVRLRARPRRQEPALFDGFFLVTPDTADLVRVEGRLARGPSFWIPRVQVTRHFARVAGRRVVVRSDSVAQVRLLGESRLGVDYEYQMIDGRDVTSAPVLAALHPPGR